MTSISTQGRSEPSGAEQKVRKSSFYTALRILPAHQRDAMYEIYAFCRDVDDIADDGGPVLTRKSEIQAWRDEIETTYEGHPTQRTKGLARAIQQFGLKKDDFLAVIDGMEMDITGDIRAPDLETLDLYCDRVASAVGRLSVRVFGMSEQDGIMLAYHLGRALQLTNILRDIDEDAALGRLYLPQEVLYPVGITTTDPKEAVDSPMIGAACSPLIDHTRNHFAEARAIMDRSPRKTVRTPRLMYEAYISILRGIIVRGFKPPRTRVRIGKLRMLYLLLRHGIV